MKLRKVLALALAGTMVFSLAACGGSGDTAKEDSGSESTESGDAAEEGSNESASSGDVELSVSIWDNNQEPGLKQIMEDFTAKTGIKVKISVVK